MSITPRDQVTFSPEEFLLFALDPGPLKRRYSGAQRPVDESPALLYHGRRPPCEAGAECHCNRARRGAERSRRPFSLRLLVFRIAADIYCNVELLQRRLGHRYDAKILVQLRAKAF